MTYNEIITLALAISHTKAGQISSTDLETFFNIARNELGNAIIKDVNENFFYEIWKRDAIANQENGEYPYPEADSDSAGMLKCLDVAVKPLSTEIFYTKAEEVDPKAMPHGWDWYLVNQPKSRPIYFIADRSIFIAPQFHPADLPSPNPSGNTQIKLEGITKFINLSAGATEAQILIPEDSHHRIAVGMKQYIMQARGKTEKAIAAKNEFEFEKLTMIDELTNRNDSLMTAKLPDMRNLGYGQ